VVHTTQPSEYRAGDAPPAPDAFALNWRCSKQAFTAGALSASTPGCVIRRTWQKSWDPEFMAWAWKHLKRDGFPVVRPVRRFPSGGRAVATPKWLKPERPHGKAKRERITAHACVRSAERPSCGRLRRRHNTRVLHGQKLAMGAPTPTVSSALPPLR